MAVLARVKEGVEGGHSGEPWQGASRSQPAKAGDSRHPQHWSSQLNRGSQQASSTLRSSPTSPVGFGTYRNQGERKGTRGD